MASEVGVVDVDSKNVFKKGRLFPGMMLLVDFEKHKVVDDEELKKKYQSRYPYAEWLQRQKLTLEEIVESVPEEKRVTPPIIGALEVSYTLLYLSSTAVYIIGGFWIPSVVGRWIMLRGALCNLYSLYE